MPTILDKFQRSRKPAPSAPTGLKRLGARVKVSEPEEKPKADGIPVVRIVGDTMHRFNEAKEEMKRFEGIVKELQPIIREEAMGYIFKHNCSVDCLNPLTSVKLQDAIVLDETDSDGEPLVKLGEVTRVSFTSKYNSCDTEQVDAAFSSLPGRDINEYVTETLAATFDDTVFLDTNGDFDQKVYDKFRVAIEKVARELGLKNDDGTVNSPLKTKRVLIVKESFHAKRFKDFSMSENFALSDVLPNTIQCVPLRTT